MFVEKPSMKKGMQKPGKSAGAPKHGKETMKDYSKLGSEGMHNTMEHCSKLLDAKALEPKGVGKHIFGNPK